MEQINVDADKDFVYWTSKDKIKVTIPDALYDVDRAFNKKKNPKPRPSSTQQSKDQKVLITYRRIYIFHLESTKLKTRMGAPKPVATKCEMDFGGDEENAKKEVDNFISVTKVKVIDLQVYEMMDFETIQMPQD